MKRVPEPPPVDVHVVERLHLSMPLRARTRPLVRRGLVCRCPSREARSRERDREMAARLTRSAMAVLASLEGGHGLAR